jgi:PPOX class probable F420-dependent enzyme
VNTRERREFVYSHRIAVFGYNRRDHGPAMTVVYYVMDGDDILVSTMTARAKAKAVGRDPKVSLCILDEKWPPTYLLVYGTATIVTNFEAVVDLRMRIAGLMAEQPIPQSNRPDVMPKRRDARNVLLRIKPYMTSSPPRHRSPTRDVSDDHDLEPACPGTGRPKVAICERRPRITRSSPNMSNRKRDGVKVFGDILKKANYAGSHASTFVNRRPEPGHSRMIAWDNVEAPDTRHRTHDPQRHERSDRAPSNPESDGGHFVLREVKS